ncbi:MAG TPA: DUF2089 domain-containing protein [Bacilli bacterium]|nr:DUF2089 domain-containing protein [Bacilli bacterium]
MRKEVISKCPICGDELAITRLHCDSCGIEISGEFSLSKLAKLSKEQLTFIEIFLKNQGSIKSVEKDMNISYPTVKKLLNEILTVLGYDKLEEDKTSTQRQEILDKLANKEITFEAASILLKKL